MKNLNDYIYESSDGWNDDEMEDLINVLDDIYDLAYEIKNGRRGAYSRCRTYQEFSDFIVGLAERLKAEGEAISDMSENDEDGDEEDERIEIGRNK